ncbi:MAG: hypothetical protein KGS48_18640, partial [Bacteroidetes bacterium]|nr:hypothetical protein [Bacteroidota bacterium]
TLRLFLEGFDKDTFTLRFDPQTRILHLEGHFDSDTWPREFVAVDGIDVNKIDEVTIQLARKRLAGQYKPLAKKGEMAIESFVELHPDGTQLGFGDFDSFEPWPSGSGAFISNPYHNLIYFVKKGKEESPTAMAWQVRGDTLRLWDTKNTAQEGDIPEYAVTKLHGAYLKVK